MQANIYTTRSGAISHLVSITAHACNGRGILFLAVWCVIVAQLSWEGARLHCIPSWVLN